jgi:hypothetical protein
LDGICEKGELKVVSVQKEVRS